MSHEDRKVPGQSGVTADLLKLMEQDNAKRLMDVGDGLL